MGKAFFIMINELSKDLEEAKATIIENRLLAWCSGDAIDTFGKLYLVPLTGKAWVDLKLVGNSIISEGNATDDDVLEYLWRNSKDYNPEATAKTEKAKKIIGYLFGKSEKGELMKIAYKHLNDAFTEMPERISTGGNKFKRENTMPAIEGIVGAIDEVAARYGQNPSDVLSWSMNRVFQLQKAIRLATIADYRLAEPRLIKMIKQEILNEINNGTESRN